MPSPPITSLNDRSVVEELRVDDLWKGFLSRTGERVEVLRGVSFSVAAGEIVAITGASGAGKSTLLHILGALESPDRGTTWMGRVDDRGAESKTAGNGSSGSHHLPSRDHSVGFVFQFHHLLPDLTALENVALPMLIARLGRSESERRAIISLRELGLGERLKERVTDLSGGEQQRVAVARALIVNPRLVLADEPTGNLDAAIGDEIGRLLIEYCRRQQAIVVIATHNERLAQICDRALLLRNGQIAN